MTTGVAETHRCPSRVVTLAPSLGARRDRGRPEPLCRREVSRERRRNVARPPSISDRIGHAPSATDGSAYCRGASSTTTTAIIIIIIIIIITTTATAAPHSAEKIPTTPPGHIEATTTSTTDEEPLDSCDPGVSRRSRATGRQAGWRLPSMSSSIARPTHSSTHIALVTRPSSEVPHARRPSSSRHVAIARSGSPARSNITV